MSVIAAGGLYAAGLAAGQSPATLLALGGGCLAGILLTPDLDVDDPVHADWIIRRQAGLLPWLVWRLFWLPYSRAIPHRHWLSHGPVIGTLLRLVYLGFLPWLAAALLYGEWWPLARLPFWWGWAVLGLGVSDTLHWAADGVQKRFHRLVYRRRWRQFIR